ncbi:MAG: TolC family protein [Longimicrobiales bacterium]
MIKQRKWRLESVAWLLMAAVSWLVMSFWPVAVRAQQTPTRAGRALTLQEALQLARASSEQITIAEAGVQRAQGELYRARSERYPQLDGNVTFVRTLRSEFSALSDDDETIGGAPCPAFVPNPALPLGARVDSLEAAMVCRDNESPFGDIFVDLPFGRLNQLNGGLALSQTVFAGGRVRAQGRMAEAGRRTAQIDLASAHAQMVLEVTQSYYDAALSDQLLAIAEATMRQADTTLVQVRLARQVGDQPEFELLRAQVTRDNQRPIVIQQRATRDLAHIRLKQLLNLSLDEPLDLRTPLEADDAVAVVAVQPAESDTSVAARAPVRQAGEAVNVQESALRIARAQRLPNVILSSQYGRVAYPVGGIPTYSQFRTNFTVTAFAQIPIHTGGRIKGDEMVAEANLKESRARLQQTRELAALDTRDALEQLQAAEASWQASAGTVGQAVRAYAIGEIRFREGISTQLELNDSRILLQQARANRAVAARDLQVARMRVALLPDLPLNAGGGNIQSPVMPQQNGGAGGAPAPSVPRTNRAGGSPTIPVQASQVSNRPGSEEP